MPVTFEQGDSQCFVRLEGDIGIDSAGELKGALLEALASGTEPHLDVSRATTLDLTAMQLLWAAMREAESCGALFVVEAPVPEELRSAARDAGLEDLPGLATSTAAQVPPQQAKTGPAGDPGLARPAKEAVPTVHANE